MNYYEEFTDKGNGNLGLYQNGDRMFGEFGVGIYNILLTGAVYLSGIAILVAVIVLMYASGKGADKLGEAKNGVVRVCLIIIGIFSVSGILSLVLSMAIT